MLVSIEAFMVSGSDKSGQVACVCGGAYANIFMTEGYQMSGADYRKPRAQQRVS